MTISAALDQVDRAVGVLRGGGVIAMPTETLYALTALASDASAVRRVFEIKGREEGKPLPLFVRNLAEAERIARLSPSAKRLASRFWPGQLTIVVEKQQDFESEALAGSPTVGLRVPAHDVALAVLEGAGGPLTGTSANLSGGANPDTAAEVRRQLGARIDLIIDAGPCRVGVPSTVIDCTGQQPVVLREGAVSGDQIAEALRV